MATIDSSIIRVQRLVGSHSLATYDEVRGFLNNRHADLLESFDWSRKKTEIAITARVDKTSGTLSPNNGSPTINGVGTAFTASDVGRYVKIGNDDNLYVVSAVNLATQFTISDLNGTAIPYPGSSATGVTYVMFSRIYSLGAGIEDIYGVKGKVQIREVSEEWIDDTDPNRTATASDPTVFARGARDMSGSNDIARIELWPRVSSPKIVTASVLRGHVDLLPNQYPIVPSGPLEWFAAQDTCFLLAARTKDIKWGALADKYRDEAEKSLERERGMDQRKFGQSGQVKDANGGVPLRMTDFALDHDLGD